MANPLVVLAATEKRLQNQIETSAELRTQIDELERENAKLRKVVDAASELCEYKAPTGLEWLPLIDALIEANQK